jgi:multiple sugar transport system permease protein
MTRQRRREACEGVLFAAPWLVGFLLLTAGPMVASFLLSFTRWNGIAPVQELRWIGGENYSRLLRHDASFAHALRNTAFYALVAVPLGMGTALSLAMLLNQRVRGMAVFRTIFYLPSVVSGVATSMLWLWLFNPSFGGVNWVLHQLRLPEPGWLTDEKTAIWVFILMSVWGVGNTMLINLAGLQEVPEHLYEAASLDGAGSMMRFRHVTLPMLSPTLFFNLVMGIIGSFQVFTSAYVMTGGGPNESTLFYVLYLYQKAFEQFQMGYASAMAWILFAIVLALTLLVIRSSRMWVYYEGERTG